LKFSRRINVLKYSQAISRVNVEPKSNFSETSSASGIKSGLRIEFCETEVLAKILGYMDRLVKESISIKLHSANVKREEGFKLSKAWNPCASLLRNSNKYTSWKSQDDTEKRMLRKENRQQEHQVKQHGDGSESAGWPHSLTPPSYCLVPQYEEAWIWQTGINMSDIWSLTTSTLIMETEEISETLVSSSTLTRLIAR
jgi:hypothetical protein